jgi:hypothetical protein
VAFTAGADAGGSAAADAASAPGAALPADAASAAGAAATAGAVESFFDDSSTTATAAAEITAAVPAMSAIERLDERCGCGGVVAAPLECRIVVGEPAGWCGPGWLECQGWPG